VDECFGTFVHWWIYWFSVPYPISSQHAVTFENWSFCICWSGTWLEWSYSILFFFSLHRTGDSRGFGFLSLEKDEDADAAIRSCDETEWNGRIILVEKSKAPTWWIIHLGAPCTIVQEGPHCFTLHRFYWSENVTYYRYYILGTCRKITWTWLLMLY